MSRIFQNSRLLPLRLTSFAQGRNDNHGFTLIEVLISVALISLVMVLIWQTTSQSLSAKKKIETRQEFYHFARIAMDKMTQDLSMAFLMSGNSHLGQQQGSPLMKTVFDGAAEELTFASLSHLRLFQGARESEAAEIGFKIERDPEDRDNSILLRRESKWVDDKPEDGGVWVPVAHKIREFKLEYYDGDKFDWKSSWNSESSERGRLPRAVKLTLTFEHPADPEKELPFTTTVLVGMHKNAIDF